MTQTQTFRFWQNNSGGGYADIESPQLSAVNVVGHNVYIEAETADEANSIAEATGIYFDGVSAGVDCDCCGDRWYRASWPERDDEDE